MNATASSPTPIAVPSFTGPGNDATQVDEFLEFLRNLVSQYLSDQAPRISSVNKAPWITVIDGLTDHLLISLPLPHVVSWSALREKVISVLTSLDVVERVFMRVDGIYHGTAEMVKKVFARLLDLCFVLDSWVDIEMQLEDELVHPKILRQRGMEVLILFLRGAGGSMLNTATIAGSSWKMLRSIISECLDVCHGEFKYIIEVLLPLKLYKELDSKLPHLSFPLTIELFSTPRISNVQPDDLFGAVCSLPRWSVL
jgi:serine/threonine-protein kinase ATR